MPHYFLDSGSLYQGDDLLLGSLGDAELVPDPKGFGAFIKFRSRQRSSAFSAQFKIPAGFAKWVAAFRYDPFWMIGRVGDQISDVPAETQFMLAERSNGLSVIVVPLVNAPFRCSLRGAADDSLELFAETGDSDVHGDECIGLFIASLSNPYELVAKGARSVARFYGPSRLRVEKAPPSWFDTFGWCTWDAFYDKVSHEKVRAGLESLASGGVTPKMLILDDGWQSVERTSEGQTRLIGFPANDKFAGGLSETVGMAKDEFGITNFLVWHAFNGYWGGVDPQAMPDYEIAIQPRKNTEAIVKQDAKIDDGWGGNVGVVLPKDIGRFFNDYHSYLKGQGVDGVKVDSQGTIESVAHGLGGRVEVTRRYREGLEQSAVANFNGNLINCMSCTMEMLYNAIDTTVTRTFTDFWPNLPESHGLHLYSNSLISLWFGEFVQPDWDMFQSGHAAGPYHAAGRIVGGSSLYVSDKPGEHNFELLRKLVRPDGSVLRADYPGRPTYDCLYRDVTKEDMLLKIFNFVGDIGVIGVFNAQGGQDAKIAGAMTPSDADGIVGEEFAVYAQTSGDLKLMNRAESWPLSLGYLGFEIFTVSPVVDGVALIGDPQMFLSAGVIDSKKANGNGEYIVKGGGKLLAWTQCRPDSVTVNGKSALFTYDDSTHRCELTIPEGTAATLRITL